MRRGAMKRWASRRTTILTRSFRSATRWGGLDRLAVGHCPKSSISTAGALPILESDHPRRGHHAIANGCAAKLREKRELWLEDTILASWKSAATRTLTHDSLVG